MSYKNNQQMALVKKAKVVYLIESLVPVVRRIWDGMKRLFRSVVEAFRSWVNEEPEYIQLPTRQPVPLAVKPTHMEPSRTVFLPIQRFRGRR